jgi:hypothetical protein
MAGPGGEKGMKTERFWQFSLALMALCAVSSCGTFAGVISSDAPYTESVYYGLISLAPDWLSGPSREIPGKSRLYYSCRKGSRADPAIASPRNAYYMSVSRLYEKGKLSGCFTEERMSDNAPTDAHSMYTRHVQTVLTSAGLPPLAIYHSKGGRFADRQFIGNFGTGFLLSGYGHSSLGLMEKTTVFTDCLGSRFEICTFSPLRVKDYTDIVSANVYHFVRFVYLGPPSVSPLDYCKAERAQPGWDTDLEKTKKQWFDGLSAEYAEEQKWFRSLYDREKQGAKNLAAMESAGKGSSTSQVIMGSVSAMPLGDLNLSSVPGVAVGTGAGAASGSSGSKAVVSSSGSANAATGAQSGSTKQPPLTGPKPPPAPEPEVVPAMTGTFTATANMSSHDSEDEAIHQASLVLINSALPGAIAKEGKSLFWSSSRTPPKGSSIRVEDVSITVLGTKFVKGLAGLSDYWTAEVQGTWTGTVYPKQEPSPPKPVVSR